MFAGYESSHVLTDRGVPLMTLASAGGFPKEAPFVIFRRKTEEALLNRSLSCPVAVVCSLREEGVDDPIPCDFYAFHGVIYSVQATTTGLHLGRIPLFVDYPVVKKEVTFNEMALEEQSLQLMIDGTTIGYPHCDLPVNDLDGRVHDPWDVRFVHVGDCFPVTDDTTILFKLKYMTDPEPMTGADGQTRMSHAKICIEEKPAVILMENRGRVIVTTFGLDAILGSYVLTCGDSDMAFGLFAGARRIAAPDPTRTTDLFVYYVRGTIYIISALRRRTLALIANCPDADRIVHAEVAYEVGTSDDQSPLWGVSVVLAIRTGGRIRRLSSGFITFLDSGCHRVEFSDLDDVEYPNVGTEHVWLSHGGILGCSRRGAGYECVWNHDGGVSRASFSKSDLLVGTSIASGFVPRFKGEDTAPRPIWRRTCVMSDKPLVHKETTDPTCLEFSLALPDEPQRKKTKFTDIPVITLGLKTKVYLGHIDDDMHWRCFKDNSGDLSMRFSVDHKFLIRSIGVCPDGEELVVLMVYDGERNDGAPLRHVLSFVMLLSANRTV